MRDVQVVFLDVDGVLTEGSSEPVASEVLEALLELSASGVHLVPLTGQDLANIEERFYRTLVHRMTPEMRAVATAYTETGARCYVYDAVQDAVVEDAAVTRLFESSDQQRLRQVRQRMGELFALVSRERDLTEAWLSVKPCDATQAEAIALRLIRELASARVEAHVFLTATGDINAVRRTKAFGLEDYLRRRLPSVGWSGSVKAAAIVDSVGRKVVRWDGVAIELSFNDDPIAQAAEVGLGGVPVRVISVGPRHDGFEVPAGVVQIGGGPKGLVRVLHDWQLLWGV